METPITMGFRAKTLSLGATHIAAGIILPLLFYQTLPILSGVVGAEFIISGIILFAINLRRKAEEKYV